MGVRYITDDVKFSCDDSDGEYFKTKYSVWCFLTRLCKIVWPQKSIYSYRSLPFFSDQ